MNSIVFKGVSSTTIDGLLICELPPISKPPMRVAETSIDGRHGTIIEELGYSAYNKTLTIGLHGNFDINKVIKYFSGEGDIVFSNEPDKVYRGSITSQIDYTRLLRFRKATVTFRVQPFKHKNNEAYATPQTATASSTNIVLKDSGATPMKISTNANSILVHGKNLIDTNKFVIGTNANINITENGYKMVAKGGANGTYTYSRCAIPIQTKGKAYTLKCDKMTSEQSSVNAGLQVIVKTPSTEKYICLFAPNTTIDFTLPEDATSIHLGLYTNNTNANLSKDNVVTVLGARLIPKEFKADAWCAFQGAQEISVVGGIAEAMGYDSATIISNADNLEMSVDYFKAFEVFNEGLEPSKPMIVLKGSGTVELKVNGMAVFTYTFPSGEDEVVIDSDIEEAYLGAVLKNRQMNGEFPSLVPKTNRIEWSGDITSISILPRSRWL